MPHRWLSLRAHKVGHNQHVETCNPCSQHDFEFAFVTEPKVLIRHNEPIFAQDTRPATSAGECYKSKRRPDLTLLVERPNTSHSSLLDQKSSTIQIDQSQIGVAFGSPRHPPRGFEKTLLVMSPSQLGQELCPTESTPNQRSRIGKWRIKNLFKPKSKPARNSYVQHRQSRDINSKPNTSKRKTPRRQAKPPPTQPDVELNSTPTDDDIYQKNISPCSTEQEARILNASSLQSAVPESFIKKHPQTTNTVDDANKSRLLVRRSKVFSQLLIKEECVDNYTSHPMPDLLRPATSPTMTRPDQSSRNYGNAGNVGRYSLFPPTPTLDKSPTRVGSPRPIRRRSSTAPSTSTSPMLVNKSTRNELPTHGVEPANPSLPQLRNAPQTFKPFAFQHFPHDSHASSQSDIFFDVKSFRDSGSQEGQHFEMTRPPSAALQLARSKSSARKQQQESKVHPLAAKSHQSLETDSGAKVTSQQLGDTITVLETLVVPEPCPQSEDHTRSGDDPKVLDAKAHANASASQTPPRGRALKDERQNPSQSTLPNLTSTISNVAEELKDLCMLNFSVSTTEKDRPVIGCGMIDCKKTESKSSKASESTSEAIKRSSSPPPPPVPIKDTRFIPMSKRTLSQPTKNQVCQNCTRPVRTKRANTDSSALPNIKLLNQNQRQPPTRAATVPLPKVTRAPLSKYAITPLVAQPSTKPAEKKDNSMTIAHVKPAAEVSIARTVSLSRRPSAKVVHPARKPSKRDQSTDDITERKVSLSVPVVQNGEKKHKPGLSLDVVLEIATIAPSSPPPIPSPNPEAATVKAEG